MKHVYAMQRADGSVKVGISEDPDRRKGGLISETRQSVSLIFATAARSDARRVEDIAHKILRDGHQTGEWFVVPIESAMSAVSQAVEIVEGLRLDTTKTIPKINKRSTPLRESKRHYHVSVGDPQAGRLEEDAKAEDISVQELIRRIISEHYKKTAQAGRK
jgi:hypothetical protein